MKRPQLHNNNGTIDTSIIRLHTEAINKCARINGIIKDVGCLVVLRHADNLYEVDALWMDDDRWLSVQVKTGGTKIRIIRVPWHTHFTLILD